MSFRFCELFRTLSPCVALQCAGYCCSALDISSSVSWAIKYQSPATHTHTHIYHFLFSLRDIRVLAGKNYVGHKKERKEKLFLVQFQLDTVKGGKLKQALTRTTKENKDGAFLTREGNVRNDKQNK